MKRMSVKEFQRCGLLMEMNRRFLHPMGLAMEVIVEEDGSVAFGEVWDCRESPDGMYFGELDASDIERAKSVRQMFEAKRDAREKGLGYHVQPAGDVL